MNFPPDENQTRIIRHLTTHPSSFLAVGMGVGKTASTLAAINKMVDHGMFRGALVVAPMRVANLVWPEEVETWDEFNWMRVANLRTEAGRKAFRHGKAQLYTINYESLPQFVRLAKERIATHGQLPYNVEVWDESTFAKNPTGKRVGKFRRELREHRGFHRWAMTGTPRPNSHLDLFAQFRLIDDGNRLGTAFEHYKHQYFRQADFMGYKWELMEGCERKIAEAVGDITLTIEGGDWPIHFEDIELPFCEELRRMYKKLETTFLLDLQSGEITAATAAALVSKLLQLTSGTVYDADRSTHFTHNLKMEALKKLAKQHKTLFVAVNFQHEQKRIRELFPQAEFFADANTPKKQEMLRDRWNAREVPILVAHPMSVGHGLNLQFGGSHLVWTTLTHNWDAYKQMIARLASRGQTDTVTVYRLMIPGTVDEAVAASLEIKTTDDRSLMRTMKMVQTLNRLGD